LADFYLRKLSAAAVVYNRRAVGEGWRKRRKKKTPYLNKLMMLMVLPTDCYQYIHQMN